MSKNSRIITRHGETPEEWSDNNLKPFEMGWSTDEKKLYINDGENNFTAIGSTKITEIIRSNNPPTKDSSSTPLECILWIDTSDNMYIPKIYDEGEWQPLGAVFY